MNVPPFEFNEGQLEAKPLFLGPSTHLMLEGGSSSGKTVEILYHIVLRAIKAPGSRHLICRFRFAHAKQSIGLETMPFVVERCFPALPSAMSMLNKSDWYFTLPNGSEIWIAGLDDKERTEKALGKRYCTIHLNECSQIPWASVQLIRSRLAQLSPQFLEGKWEDPLKLRMFYDQNPPNKGHWSYQVFHLKRDPDTKRVLPDPQEYKFHKINPEQNEKNLAPGAIDILRNSNAQTRRRFLEGNYAEDNPYALFNEITIDKYRDPEELPDFIRVIIGVDPSGSGDTDNQDNDEIGITVVGLGTNSQAYLLEDLSIKKGPATWGSIAAGAFLRHNADLVVAEKNFGGEMVRFTIQASNPNVAVKLVNSSRGKVVRAEPFSALYEQGKIHHVGRFQQLEEELSYFTQNGYTGSKSPNRADALIFCLTELFYGIVEEKKESKPMAVKVGGGWW